MLTHFNRFLLKSGFMAAFLLAGFFSLTGSVHAQASVVEQPASPKPGQYVFPAASGQYGLLWAVDTTAPKNSYWAALSADTQAHGGFSLPALDGNGNSAWDIFGRSGKEVSEDAVGRLCSLVDPTSSLGSGSIVGRQYAHPSDNTVIFLNGGTWQHSPATSNNCPSNDDCDSSLDSFACMSNALPSNTLTASSYTISPGQSVTLTWDHANDRDDVWYPGESGVVEPYFGSPGPAVTCTANFPIPPTGQSVNLCTAYSACEGQSACGCRRTNDFPVQDFSGTTPVSPMQTTMYTYSCTNGNGTTIARATVNVTGAAPNLTASAVTPTAATAGTATTFSSTISNTGSAATGAGFTNKLQYATAYNASTDEATGVVDTSATSVFSTALANGTTRVASFSYTFPTSDGGTTRYLRACADLPPSPSGAITNETSEIDNCGAWTAIAVAGPAVNPTADLACTPPSVTSGGSATITWSSTNATSCTGTGFSTGGATNNTNGVSTGALTSDTPYNLSCTGAGGTTPASDSCIVTVTPAGNFPNLTASAVTPTAATAGTATTFSSTISNTGSAATGAGFTNKLQYATAYNASTDEATGIVDAVATTAFGTGVSAGSNRPVLFNYTFSSGDAGTTRYLRACADLPPSSYGVIDEGPNHAGEGNNCSGWIAITVSAGACYGQGCTGPGGSCQYPGGSQPTVGNPAHCCAATAGICPALPTASLTPASQTINAGQKATFSWTSTNAASCVDVATPPAFDNGPTSGSGVQTGVLTSTQTYQLRCTGPGGIGYSNQALVKVNQPGGYITATPLRVASGLASVVGWSASSVTSCTVVGSDGYNSGPRLADAGGAIATTTVSRTINNQTKFTLTCQTAAAPVVTSVIVNVLPSFQEF